MDETFAQLANPWKQKIPRRAGSELSFGSSSSNSKSHSEKSKGSTSGNSESSRRQDDEGSLAEEDPYEAPLKPSEGYSSLEEEKADILLKLQRMKRQGIAGMRAFSPTSDIRDLRTEFSRIKSEIDIEASIKFQRKIIMAVISTLEFMNKRYDPFDLHLDGFSEHTMESIEDYDRVFERLYFKYKNRVSMPPEMELLVTIGGSAFMFHLSHTLMKQSLPGLTKNPELMQSMMSAMATANAPQQQPQPQQQGSRREMSGPGIDLSAMMGGNMPTGFPPMPVRGDMPPPPPPPQQEQTPPQEPSRKREASDRLSDIISEDLEDVPDDLQSIAPSELTGGDGVRSVKVTQSAMRGARKKKSAGNAAKKVMFV
jgi:hypothetical protein